MKTIRVYKNRTNVLLVRFGRDISADEFSSQIKEDKTSSSEVVVAWAPSFETDGTDGVLRLVLSNELIATITKSIGYMDIKRMSAGEPLPVFKELIEVHFKETITT